MKQIAFIGNYLPRQCGIATFTTDLCESVAELNPDMNCLAAAVTDTEAGYAYPPQVRLELIENDLLSYERAADFLNLQNVDVVCLQHEFGIFGGRAGSHLLTLLRRLRMPIVTTLHTVLCDPNPQQREVFEEVLRLSERLAVMSQTALHYLKTIYHVPDERIDFIPHGIPDVPFIDPNFYKDQFDVEGKTVLLTFGLLSPNKGIEHVIEALPTVLARYPDVVYIVLGATHPNVKREQGEAYRHGLRRLARERGVEPNVIFHDRFVSLQELVEFIGAADIYVTPYLNPQQIVSGALAYTVGAGKAVISTPYGYAEELLADGRGLLVPFGDPAAIAQQVLYLLDHEAERHAMRKRAYRYGRDMIWPEVAQRYVESFERARARRVRQPRLASGAATRSAEPERLPALNLDQLRRLTDSIGLLQHAIYTLPHYGEGYTTDDNARALSVSISLEEVERDWYADTEELSTRYLAFLWHAFNAETGRFRNFMSFDRRWLEAVGSEECHGRAVRSLGLALNRSSRDLLCDAATRLFDAALPAALEFTSPRAWADTLIGLQGYLHQFPGDRRAGMINEVLAERLMALYRANRTQDWRWFEDRLTYDNAKLAHALLACGQGHGAMRLELIETGLEALDWLTRIQRPNHGHFAPIGCQGFWPREGQRAHFDQQPIEAYSTVAACLEAYRLTGHEHWRREARYAFEWFLGRNDLGLPLYDPNTGGCCDGLQPDGINRNQGAESTLAFLLALLEMRRCELAIHSEIEAPAKLPRLRMNAPTR
ncbi:MAG TPA: glycosyltransferase family 4 protein [Anaerolineae bacterium]|nr:glycosyltransferase family 4 protein [Anaerolineae bacterium]